MSPRATPLLLAALAGAGAVGTVVAWCVVPDGGTHAHPGLDHHAPSHERHPRRESERALVLDDARRDEERRASPIVAVDEAPCLELGHTSITGRVVDGEGRPVADARVAILAAPHAPDSLQVRGETRTDELGRFDVRTAKPGDLWLAAWSPTLRPGVHKLTVDEGFVDLAQPLRLEEGASIGGRVLAGEEPLARVELEAVAPRHARRVRAGEDELALIDGALEWGAPRCTTGEDGAWEFRGLAPGRWVVRPHAFRCPGAVFPPGALAAETIDAPARDVDLRIASARLALDVQLDGEPLAWAEVEVEYRGVRSARRADAHGKLEIDVSPNEGMAIVVRAPGRQPARHLITGPRRGERREERIDAGAPLPSTGTKAGSFPSLR